MTLESSLSALFRQMETIYPQVLRDHELL
jgi:hypothetical protein